MAETQHNQGNPRFTIHDRLRKAREWAGLEQTELAELIEVDRGSVSNYETGKTTRLKSPVLKRWAMTCEVDIDWIRDGIEPTSDEGPGQVIDASGWFSGSPEPDRRYNGPDRRAA